MRRSILLVLAGIAAALVGGLLALRANALATAWQPLGGGAWGGTTDPARRQLYQQLGLIVVCAGLAVVAAGSWAWAHGPRAGRRYLTR